MVESGIIGEKEFVRLLSVPQSYSEFDLQTIERLLAKYPYCQSVHYVYAAALKRLKSDKFDTQLQKSAAYSPARDVLFQYVEQPQNVKKIFFEQSVDSAEAVTSAYDLEKAAVQEIPENDTLVIEENQQDSDSAIIEAPVLLQNEEETAVTTDLLGEEVEAESETVSEVLPVGEEEDQVFEEISEVEPTDVHDAVREDVEESLDFNIQTDTLSGASHFEGFQEEEELFDEISDIDTFSIESPETNEFNQDEEAETIEEQPEEAGIANETVELTESVTSDDNSSLETVIPEQEEPHWDETATEITLSAITIQQGVNSSIADEIETVIPDFEWPLFEYDSEYVAEQNDTPIKEEPVVADIPETLAKEVPQERLIVDSIAASDYFIFDKSAVDPLQSEEVKEKPHAELQLLPVEQPQDPNDVSKYHDDTLPFTFLWWLHKTRKEHSTYQPYLPSQNQGFNVQASGVELNQQIIENIFHHQPELNTFPEALPESKPQLELRKKEDDLIERFIKEEPQIKPPFADKIDTENKARKSSEDNLDLVSETLARIYIDQMLFHKAIDTYKKLSLKFPEKSTYFAAQISDLEKRIN